MNADCHWSDNAPLFYLPMTTYASYEIYDAKLNLILVEARTGLLQFSIMFDPRCRMLYQGSFHDGTLVR
jgi:hypothetical protein